MSIGGWSPNDCDPNSDLSPTLEEIEQALKRKGSDGGTSAWTLICERIRVLRVSYPDYQFLAPCLSMDGPFGLQGALAVLEEMEAELCDAWLAGKLRRAG